MSCKGCGKETRVVKLKHVIHGHILVINYRGSKLTLVGGEAVPESVLPYLTKDQTQLLTRRKKTKPKR
jgi:hypothetical protein